MANKTCPLCGSTCDVIFRPYIVKDGKTIYPKKGRVFPIPVCDCQKKN